jgi:hypothetical protein
MTKRRALALILVAFLVGATAATAAQRGWRVVSSGTANVSASIDSPSAVAIRSTAGQAEVTWSVLCSGQIVAARGRVYMLTPSRADDCTVSALGVGTGRVRVQVLSR